MFRSALRSAQDMMAMQAWEFLEIGELQRAMLTCSLESSYALKLVTFFQPENKGKTLLDMSKKRTKAGLSKRAEKILGVIQDSALCKREGDEKMMFLGNFIHICKVNRSFTYQTCRLQLDISSLCMGSNFWKRQRKWREKR